MEKSSFQIFIQAFLVLNVACVSDYNRLKWHQQNCKMTTLLTECMSVPFRHRLFKAPRLAFCLVHIVFRH